MAAMVDREGLLMPRQTVVKKPGFIAIGGPDLV